MILAVTSFVPIPDHPRSEAEYHELGARLEAARIPLLRMDGELEECWLWRWLHETYTSPKDLVVSAADNPEKNSFGYHCVQAQKSEWLVAATEFAAAQGAYPDVLVWIDYGIFHIPGVTAQIIRDFVMRANQERTIAIPGCWDKGGPIDDRYPCWRFCGGVMIVPRQYVYDFDMAMKNEYVRGLHETDTLTWEVNVLARVEQNTNLPIWWYYADHDQTIFTNYRTVEFADARRGSRQPAFFGAN